MNVANPSKDVPRMGSENKKDEDQLLFSKIADLIQYCNIDVNTLDANLISQIIYSSLKIVQDKHDTGQIKLMTRAFKEMRYAYRIFNQYSGQRISIFGSARTPENHPDYIAAKKFSQAMASLGWMCITGAANGIMKAGMEGATKESSFGLSIRLPHEIPTNSFIAGDPKLITFRYFFTRKLMFLSHSDAIAAFPGGFGTLDELFEALTLMQTGKASIIPVILLEGEGGYYWEEWLDYVDSHLLHNRWISPEDNYLFYHAKSVEAAVEHVQKFYSRYHSSRYVHDLLVIRMKSPIPKTLLPEMTVKFKDLIEVGEIEEVSALPEETDHLDLPRIAFYHNKKHFGLLRHLIDFINSI